jgi:hypothetical protein
MLGLSTGEQGIYPRHATTQRHVSSESGGVFLPWGVHIRKAVPEKKEDGEEHGLHSPATTMTHQRERAGGAESVDCSWPGSEWVAE